MTIIPANQVKCDYSREDIVNLFCENLMSKIQDRAADGDHSMCFDASVYYHTPSRKLFSQYDNAWKKGECEFYKYRFDDYEDEVREKFRQAGYVIKPTGYIGGVWQKTETIWW